MKLESVFSDLWLAAFWGPLAVGIILFLVSKLFSKNAPNKTVTLRYVQEVVVKHVIEIKERKGVSKASSPRRPSERKNKSDDSAPIVIGVGLLLLSFFYAKYQIEFIAAVMGFSTFILSFIMFTVFFGISKNIVHDLDWKRYLYTTFLLALLGYPMMYIALNPFYAPIEVSNMNSAINNDGIVGMFKEFGIKGVGFLMFQSLGFITLTMAMLLQTLSLTFYTAITQLAITEIKRPVVSFIAQLTTRFQSPYRVMVISVVLYISSFILISGIGYDWWYSAASNRIS